MIRSYCYLNDMHEKFLSEDYFPLVGSLDRYPRYTNKRCVDPQVQLFIDEHQISYLKEWDLPVPNREAAYKSFAKYGKPEVILSVGDVDIMNRAYQWMCSHFSPYMSESHVLPLTEAYMRLDMSTSSGSPFNQLYPTKKELFDKDPGILQWLEADWERLATDDDWTCIFSSSLKEEIRPNEKISENSIRTFTAGAVDATVHGTRLFAEMNEKMYDAHLVTASTIGMSPLKGNWDKLYRKLAVFKKGFALDESQFDSSLRKFLMWNCALFRWNCLSKADQTADNYQRIRTYYRNLVNTLVLTADGVLVFKKTGQPSGSVNTVTDNTLILYQMMAFAWIKTAPQEYSSFNAFEDNTAKALLGDDNTWSVSDEAVQFYNATSVIEVWKLLGITTTTDTLQPRLPVELDFLSAHTVFIHGVAVPLYDRNKLMQSLLYAPRKGLTPETTMQRVGNLLQIGWADLQFRSFCRRLIAWLLCKYDHVLKDDARWILAKCGVMSDAQLFALFTGLPSSSYWEVQERSVSPINANERALSGS